MKELGLRHYQYSMAWPRVLPDGVGRVNRRGLDFYDRLTDALLEAGVTPTPILHVWDMPVALYDRGGWANRDSAEWFAEYASVLFHLVGDRASHWFTLCEPMSMIRGDEEPAARDLGGALQAGHHINLAHGRAVQAFRASGAAGQIGTATLVVDTQPATARPEDVAAAARVNAFYNELFLDPVMLGRYPEPLMEFLGDRRPAVEDGDLEVISTPIDFVGVTYYFGQTVEDADGGTVTGPTEGGGDGIGASLDSLTDILGARVRADAERRTGLGWPIHPSGVTRVLRWIAERYGSPPIIVTENGASFDDTVVDGRVDDAERIQYLRDHFIAAHDAIDQGVDLRGWFVWAFLDTWEFSLGFKGRFGLIHIDYDSLTRTVKDSGRWFAQVMAGNGFEAP
jgi:beta-glucosidase